MGRTAHRVLFAVCMLLASGCAHWSKREASDDLLDGESALPPLQVAGDSITFEVAQVTITEEYREGYDEAWREIDELAIDADLRGRLQENGFRLGRISGALPVGLQELVSRPRDVLPTDGKLAAYDQIRIQRIQFSLGREKEIPVGSARANLNLLLNENGKVRGKTLHDAECRFTLKAESEVDGSRVSLRPWIVHGPLKQSFTGEGGAWRIAPERQHADFPELAVTLPMAPGETLVIAPTAELRGVGKMFFGETPKEPRVLLIRLASNKANELFDDGAAELAPISSLGE